MSDIIRLVVTITEEEKAALVQLGQMQRRDPCDQAAVLIRLGLVQYGLIDWTPTNIFPLTIEDPDNDSQLLRNG